ncbi:hypothetical protein CK203_060478 [Vitis vinifera]|uniref:Uncharacterized protein n=1 Tax=Vitis vinifera TaxID=29760 RepID=A0A438GJT3_VITVI|nr:hypothetical protein CK203_060478 [Vitis vinifera]
MISKKGIEVDPDKIRVILDMLVPKTEKKKSIKGSVVADHLASLPTFESEPVDDNFLDEEFVAITSLSVLRLVRGDWKTRDAKLKPYHTYLELLIENFEELKYIHLSRASNQLIDALATLAPIVHIPIDVMVCSLLIETRSTPAYFHLIKEAEV